MGDRLPSQLSLAIPSWADEMSTGDGHDDGVLCVTVDAVTRIVS